MMHGINKLIDDEIFYHHFQPVFNLSVNQPIGYETLLRTTMFDNPAMVFNSAIEVNRLFELDVKSLKKSIETISNHDALKDDQLLFVNIYPTNLADNKFEEFVTEILHRCSLKPYQIVFEINEGEVIKDMEILQEKIKQLRNLGCLLAIDDVGKGAASLRVMIETQPDFIKLDKYFSNELSESTYKQALIKSFITYCEGTHTKLVLEGLEEGKDLQTAIKMGVILGQGFLLGKPKPIN
ncbi:EAL domain-containing protein [Filobacillus milosensis]|uniref:EAL domain-containing protein n=1 Tax=Filobacillus milosensis TaxID=94137 RepID=A0A4Y8IXS3_9BACI|nr:EAL domain-containing protein [Filobacillus milosensis]TFB24324.1 EAL domain-containing protein [Filobacillus milosensis]